MGTNSDRNTASFIGGYTSTVADQFVRTCIRPQENGYKTGARLTYGCDGSHNSYMIRPVNR